MNPVPPRSSSILATGGLASSREMIEAADRLLISFAQQKKELKRVVREARSVQSHRWIIHDLEEEIKELHDLEELRKDQLGRRRGPPVDDHGSINAFLHSPYSRQRRENPLVIPVGRRLQDALEASASVLRQNRESGYLPATHEMSNPPRSVETPIHREHTATTPQDPIAFRRPEAGILALIERRRLAGRRLVERAEQELNQTRLGREIYQLRNRTIRTSLTESDLDVMEFAWRADERLPSYTAAMRSPPPPYDWRDAVYGRYANTPVPHVPRHQRQVARDLRQVPQTPRAQQEVMRIRPARDSRSTNHNSGPISQTHRPPQELANNGAALDSRLRALNNRLQEVTTDRAALENRLRALNNRLNPQAARSRNEVTRETGSRASFSQQGGTRNPDLLE